jgi:hypothetical protein
MPWVQPGWIESGWVEVEAVAPPTGTVILSFLGPAFAGGMTSYGDQSVMTLPYERTRGDYGVDLLWTLATWAGLRIYGMRAVPEEIQSDEIERRDSLLELSGPSLTHVPLGTEVVASLAISEQSGSRAVLNNMDKHFSKLVLTEPVLTMPSGNFLYFGPGYPPILHYRGQVQRIVIKKSRCIIEVSEP